MDSIFSLIQKYQSGSPDACEQILQRMTPLVKKYAFKIHCMEYEDALQEFYITILETLRYLSLAKSEGECVKYMATAVANRYKTLCRYHLSAPKTEDIDNCSSTLTASVPIDDTYFDIAAYIDSFPSLSNKHRILSLFFYEDMSDSDIAATLNLSRQYVNRMKKQLIENYFSETQNSCK